MSRTSNLSDSAETLGFAEGADPTSHEADRAGGLRVQRLEEHQRTGGVTTWTANRAALLVVVIVAVLAAVALATSGGGLPGFGRAEPSTAASLPADGPGITAPVVAASPEKKVLMDVAGAGTTRTKDFSPPSAWTLAWAYDCSLPTSVAKGFVLSVGGMEGRAPISHKEARGSGVETFAAGGGAFHLQVDSKCAWTVKVVG